MDELTRAFWKAHDGLPREAPGSDETTRMLLRLVGDLPDRPNILDVGCGTGPSSIALAVMTNGHVTAVDIHKPYLDALKERACAAGVDKRIHPLKASMDSLPIARASVDLMWAEGSAYVIGFDAALEGWRPLLSPQGVLVLTEAEWITSNPSDEARAFWGAGYPAMRTTAGNVRAAQDAGWRVLATYALPENDWDNYYGPLRTRIEDLKKEGFSEQVLQAVGEEIDLRSKHGEDYSYTGYVLSPRR